MENPFKVRTGKPVAHFLRRLQQCHPSVWKDLHDNVTRNHTCATMDELLDRVHHYLEPRRRTGSHRYVAG